MPSRRPGSAGDLPCLEHPRDPLPAQRLRVPGGGVAQDARGTDAAARREGAGAVLRLNEDSAFGRLDRNPRRPRRNAGNGGDEALDGDSRAGAALKGIGRNGAESLAAEQEARGPGGEQKRGGTEGAGSLRGADQGCGEGAGDCASRGAGAGCHRPQGREREPGGEAGEQEDAAVEEQLPYGCRPSRRASIVAGPMPLISSSCSMEARPPCSSR